MYFLSSVALCLSLDLNDALRLVNLALKLVDVIPTYVSLDNGSLQVTVAWYTMFSVKQFFSNGHSLFLVQNFAFSFLLVACQS